MMTKNNRCPFNWYRTSGDINAGATSWLQNLQTTTKFQDYDKPLSVPGWTGPNDTRPPPNYTQMAPILLRNGMNGVRSCLATAYLILRNPPISI